MTNQKSLDKKKPKVSLTIHKQPSVLSNKKCETQPKEVNNLLKGEI